MFKTSMEHRAMKAAEQKEQEAAFVACQRAVVRLEPEGVEKVQECALKTGKSLSDCRRDYVASLGMCGL